jgi:hypothetical protein
VAAAQVQQQVAAAQVQQQVAAAQVQQQVAAAQWYHAQVAAATRELAGDVRVEGCEISEENESPRSCHSMVMPLRQREGTSIVNCNELKGGDFDG